MSTQVIPQDFSEIRWRGHWIWVPADEDKIEPGGFLPGEAPAPKREAHGFFRKAFELQRVPERAPARITADSRYALYVNGVEVFRGPVRSQPRRMGYDLFDLAPYLAEGRNVLAVYVKYYGRSKAYWMPATPNIMLGRSSVMVFEANIGESWMVSDATWKARLSDAYSDDGYGEGIIGGGVAVEVVDARRLPHGWRSADFDDAAWGTAQVVPAVHIGGYARTQPPTDPYGPLYPRPIAKLGGVVQAPASASVQFLQGAVDASAGSPIKRLESSMALPVADAATPAEFPIALNVLADGAARLVFDMGRIVSGFAQFDVVAPAGMTFEFDYVETPIKGASGMLGSHSGSRYIARGEHDQHQIFDSNGFRYAYVLVHGVAGAVTVNSFSVQESVYPWQAGAAFECSDDDLNAIYHAGIRTVQLNSQDAFMDCPTREQRAWVGDSVVHQMVHLATNVDWRLAWHYLTLSNSPRPDGILPMSVVGEIEASGSLTIPDWSLHWVHGVYNLYRFTGDKDQVKALMPTVERVLRWYAPYLTLAGLLKDVVEWNLIDWASISNEDTSAVITAIWARGLREFAEMAEWLEERSSQRWAEGLHARVKAGFDVFWDEARGSYVDHVKEGVPQREMSQLAGALAICANIAPRERWSRIIEAITDPAKLVVRSWSGGGGDYQAEKLMKQFQGIYETDWDAENEIVIAQPFMSYVVHDAAAQAGLAGRLPALHKRWLLFLADGYDTIGECWGWGTHVHGWSCAPTRDMMFYVLGVTPAKPGYASARIAPRLGPLSWVRGSVPTPHGLITVDATAERVVVESPVPIALDLEDAPPQTLPAGRHEVVVRR
jgi:hypothetical protein